MNRTRSSFNVLPLCLFLWTPPLYSSFIHVVNKWFILFISFGPIFGCEYFFRPFLSSRCAVDLCVSTLEVSLLSGWQVHFSWHFPLSSTEGPSHSIRQLQLSRLTFDLSETGCGISACLRALAKSYLTGLQHLIGHDVWHDGCGVWQMGGQGLILPEERLNYKISAAVRNDSNPNYTYEKMRCLGKWKPYLACSASKPSAVETACCSREIHHLLVVFWDTKLP